MRVLPVLTVIVLLSPWPAGAQPHKPALVADARTGCRIWNLGAPATWTVNWSGACQDGLATGQGILRWLEDGHEMLRHEGGYLAGTHSGHGVMIFPTGERHEGEWRDDNRNGQGTTIYANGDRCNGNFRDNLMCGHGVFSFASGNGYDGEWRNDYFNGRGIRTWSNGDRYDGEWRDGKANGKGRLVTSDGIYDGIWTDGCFKVPKGWIAIDVNAKSCE
jgi:hypothetical protein